MRYPDVLIHTNETLTTNKANYLIESLDHTNGVISTKFDSHHQHMMMVSYDAEITHPKDLINQVIAMGYHAQAVGL